MRECISACALPQRALDRDIGNWGPRTCLALAGIREQGKMGPSALQLRLLFLLVNSPHYLPLMTQATTAVSPMQRPPSQKTTSFCMSPPWRILSQER